MRHATLSCSVLLLGGLLACQQSDVHTPPDLPRFETARLTAEEQEEHARQYPPCALADVDAALWVDHTAPSGVRLRLPPGFDVHDSDHADQRFWEGADGSFFLVAAHDGDGRSQTGIQLAFDDDEADHAWEEGPCSFQLAGRTALLFQHEETHGDRRFYHAAVDVGITAGQGLGVAVVAPSAERRAELVTAIASIRYPAVAERPAP